MSGFCRTFSSFKHIKLCLSLNPFEKGLIMTACTQVKQTENRTPLGDSLLVDANNVRAVTRKFLRCLSTKIEISLD